MNPAVGNELHRAQFLASQILMQIFLQKILMCDLILRY